MTSSKPWRTARTRHVEAGILLSSPLVFQSSKQIGELAIAKRLPLISLFGEFPKAGGLIAYGPNVGEMFRRCGEYVGKILDGAKPSDLPIQRPDRFDFRSCSIENLSGRGVHGTLVGEVEPHAGHFRLVHDVR